MALIVAHATRYLLTIGEVRRFRSELPLQFIDPVDCVTARPQREFL